jgi:DNA ligase 1
MKYLYLVNLYQSFESTSRRLDKTYYLSRFLKEVPSEDLSKVVLLIQGRVFPTFDNRKIGVASKLVLKAINLSSGIEVSKVEAEWRETGDLGQAAANLIKKKQQATLFSQNLTVDKVFNNLRKLAMQEGAGTVDMKVKLISELLTSAQPDEAKYIVRTVLEEMRVGVGDGSIRDAVVCAYFPKIAGVMFKCDCGEWNLSTKLCMKCGEKLETSFSSSVEKCDGKVLKVSDISELKDVENYDCVVASNDKIAREVYNYLLSLVENAYNMLNDYGLVAKIAKEDGRGGLLAVGLEVGRPVKVMLYPKAQNIADAFERVGKPAAFEYKYDGFRMLIHKTNDSVALFTRRLEDVTAAFPEVKKFVLENVDAKNCIIDCEAVGYSSDTGKYLPFQSISQRIRRKHDIASMAQKFPVELVVFDVLLCEGESLLNKEFQERRAVLTKIVKVDEKKIVLSKQLITSDDAEAQTFYDDALKDGQEGVMVKNLSGVYKPGVRVGQAVKLKPVMETLDLVVVGSEWGEGKRSEWMTSFVLACRDENTGDLLEIGKVGTGFKELEDEDGVSFKEMTGLLKPLTISESGKEVKVKPEVIMEVNYEEIQKSTNYGSGFALRFPRVVRLRSMEKSVEDISSLEFVEDLYHTQKGRG